MKILIPLLWLLAVSSVFSLNLLLPSQKSPLLTQSRAYNGYSDRASKFGLFNENCGKLNGRRKNVNGIQENLLQIRRLENWST